MAAKIVNAGLNRIADTASQTSGYSASRYIRVMAIDDSATAFTAGATTLGSPSNVYDAAFDGTPTRSSQTVSHVMTVPTGSGNFTIRRISLHDDTAANVTGSSTTLVGGIDAQSLTKTSDFTITFTVRILYADAS